MKFISLTVILMNIQYISTSTEHIYYITASIKNQPSVPRDHNARQMNLRLLPILPHNWPKWVNFWALIDPWGWESPKLQNDRLPLNDTLLHSFVLHASEKLINGRNYDVLI